MAGHLFITRGDLRHLACDAILVPSGLDADGRRGHLVRPWTKLDLPLDGGVVANAPQGDERVRKIKDRRGAAPAIWVGHTGEDGRTVEDDLAVIVDFLAQASAEPVTKPRPLDCDRPLLGIPLVGTGAGGRHGFKGEAVDAFVAEVTKWVQSAETDVVLVLKTPASYAAAQQARLNRQASSSKLGGPGNHLTRLAEEAAAGRLVLFMGAGTSMGAGLPSWGELLSGLMLEAGLDEDAREQLAKADNRDIGAVLEGRLGPDALKATVAQRTAGTHVALLHQLLANLPVREALTTNYDTLFEQAWDDAGRAHAVLPRDGRSEAERWLLKLHGSVDDTSRIVLSRSDYLRLEGEGTALAGVVHAVLLTRHLLFVGYSLSDDNFHRMVHQVRDTVRGSVVSANARLGTVFTPDPVTVIQEIWEPEITFLSTAGTEGPDVRRLAIVLDELAALTAPVASHLLDPAFDAVFTSDELAIRDAVQSLERFATADDVRPALRLAVGDALAPFKSS